ncbi:hypothetical protein YQE_05486, partial [Dendroctonus ponderosae]
MSAELIFTIFYLLISFGIVYPPEEFISAGFTIGNWFGKLLGSEDENFIRFHIKKSMLNLVVYSCLPIIYVALLYLLGFVDEELDQCLGCLQARPGIKIQKQCPDEGIHPMEQKCTDCFCRPMWCLDCLTKWFVSRQDKDEQNRWLSKKCTCPMCRATFCVLDVCLLEQPQE